MSPDAERVEDPETASDHLVASATGPDHWTRAPLVALDLEGTGAQDREHEAILEIALVPLIDGHPATDSVYTTLINPGRPVPRRPWISPGLTDAALTDAPSLDRVRPELARRLAGAILVGHNIGVDWRLLRRRCPDIAVTGLVDTLRLARHVHGRGSELSLTALVDRHRLADQIDAHSPGSRPHRAAWDATAAALLLWILIGQLQQGSSLSTADLLRLAGTSRGAGARRPGHPGESQPALFE